MDTPNGYTDAPQKEGVMSAKEDIEAGMELSAALARAWDEGFQDGRRQDAEGEDGPRFVNPYL